MTTISLVAAMAKNRVIGVDNQLPWHLPADLKHFKALTVGKPIIMGRKTFCSLGKPLPNRTNIIITHQKDFVAPGCVVCHSIDTALKHVQPCDEVMIIGGANIYQQFLPLAHRLYITYVDVELAGDSYFPDFSFERWRLMSNEQHLADERNAYNYAFTLYERVLP